MYTAYLAVPSFTEFVDLNSENIIGWTISWECLRTLTFFGHIALVEQLLEFMLTQLVNSLCHSCHFLANSVDYRMFEKYLN